MNNWQFCQHNDFAFVLCLLVAKSLPELLVAFGVAVSMLSRVSYSSSAAMSQIRQVMCFLTESNIE